MRARGFSPTCHPPRCFFLDLERRGSPRTVGSKGPSLRVRGIGTVLAPSQGTLSDFLTDRGVKLKESKTEEGWETVLRALVDQ